MKQLKWLIDLANSKPLLFSVALLLIGIMSLTKVVIDRDRKIDDCNFEKTTLRLAYERKIDSLIHFYTVREDNLNNKMEEQLRAMIEGYKQQVNEQKTISTKVNKTLSRNKDLIQTTTTQLENLKQ